MGGRKDRCVLKDLSTHRQGTPRRCVDVSRCPRGTPGRMSDCKWVAAGHGSAPDRRGSWGFDRRSWSWPGPFQNRRLWTNSSFLVDYSVQPSHSRSSLPHHVHGYGMERASKVKLKVEHESRVESHPHTHVHIHVTYVHTCAWIVRPCTTRTCGPI